MRVSADRKAESLLPNGSERLKANSETIADAQSAAKGAATISEKTIAALKLISTSLTDLSNRINTLERRSSEITFENLRSSVEELSHSLEHNRVITNKSIEEFDQRLTILAKYAVVLNQKITDLPVATAGKGRPTNAADAIRSDNQTQADNTQSEPSIQTDSVAGLLSNVQASVNDLIERIESLERRITKLEWRETTIEELSPRLSELIKKLGEDSDQSRQSAT
jgi:uncharacterized coiled-coil protein SlyX